MAGIAPGLEGLAQPIEGILEDPKNARTHTDKSVAGISKSLAKFGQRKPIIVRKATNTVIAGNGTLRAAKSLGWDQLAVLYVDDDKALATAYALADNKTAELSTWDDQALQVALKYLSEDTPDYLESLGFSDDELDELLPNLVDSVAEFSSLPDIIDGINESASARDPSKRANVKIQVGEYQFEVQGEAYDAWKNRVATEVGFEKSAIRRAIADVLGIQEVMKYVTNKGQYRGDGQTSLERTN